MPNYPVVKTCMPRKDLRQLRNRALLLSVGSTLIFWVQMLQFYSSVLGFELPIDFGVFAVSLFLPGSGFVRKRLFVGKAGGSKAPAQAARHRGGRLVTSEAVFGSMKRW